MTVRDERQAEFAEKWLNNGKFGILDLCPRFGKCRVAINIFNKMKPKSILIAYPDNKIRDSWLGEFEELGYDGSNVVFTTHLSLKKHAEDSFDLVVIDEIHLLSNAQINVCKGLFKYNKYILGLTGTLSSSTEETLAQELDILVIAKYPIRLAITEGVIVDYEIVVHTTPLDTVNKVNYKGKLRTEKQQFDAYSWAIDQAERQNRNTMFLRLSRMRLIQNSVAKKNLTKKLLKKYEDERVLVFCGVTKIADSLDIPSYHSKSTEKNVFQDFAEGKGNHLAVVKIGNTGKHVMPV